jgi:hypothetical protein
MTRWAIDEGVLRSVHHVGDRRGDLECWSILPGELSARTPEPS